MWLVCAIIAAILWGLNYTLAEKILHHISPMTLLAFEMLIGAISFFVLSYFMTLKEDIAAVISQSNLLLIIILEIVVVLIANFLIVYSIQAKNATVTGFVELIYPLFTIFFTWILFHENHLSKEVMIGGGLIMIGVYLISLS